MLIDLKGDVLTEHVVSCLIENGELKKLIQKANKLYRQRCQLATDLLTDELGDSIQMTKPNGGMALWLKFEEDFPLQKVIEKASSRGLKIVGSTYCRGKNSDFNAFRFGFASVNETELEKAVNIFKNSILGLK